MLTLLAARLTLVSSRGFASRPHGRFAFEYLVFGLSARSAVVLSLVAARALNAGGGPEGPPHVAELPVRRLYQTVLVGQPPLVLPRVHVRVTTPVLVVLTILKVFVVFDVTTIV